MTQQKKKSKDNPVIACLKRLFSNQKKAMLIAVCTLALTGLSIWLQYASRRDARPAQLSLEYSTTWLGHEDSCLPIDKKISTFVCLKKAEPYNGTVQFSDGLGGLVTVHNRCNKSVTGLNVIIDVVTDLNINQDDIDKNYEIIRCDTTFDIKDIKLQYKYDFLRANSTLPAPVHSMKDVNKNKHLVAFLYQIAYDGIREPLVYNIYNQVYMCSNVSIPDSIINQYLDECYQMGCFQEKKARSLVTIPLTYKMYVVKSPAISSEEDFESFKKDFIENWHNIDYYSK